MATVYMSEKLLYLYVTILIANIVSSGFKIVHRPRRRKYDPVIIERAIGIMLGTSHPCTDLS